MDGVNNSMSKKINIRPTTSVYATYKNIRYDPWTAIAEFVDNSTQSYYDNKERLENTKYWKGLEVDIEYSNDESCGDKLIIRDNAFGMDFNDFQRAIILDSRPAKTSRSEFGMGLKTAACWFGTCWSVETAALGSGIKYRTEVDVNHLATYKNEELVVEEIPCHPSEHGTTITIWNLNRKLSGRQIGKTKDQLRGIYRTDIRSGDVCIRYNSEALEYIDPKLLTETLSDGTEKIWRKDIDFTFEFNGEMKRVYGFIGLLDEGSTSKAGFTLIRFGRVIVGGYGGAYRPEEIFDTSNSYVYQRLFGELNLDGWRVTQTKDAFDLYGGLEDILIEKLLDECLEFKQKAKTYRKRDKSFTIDTGTKILAGEMSKKGVINEVSVSPIPTESAVISPSNMPDEQLVKDSEEVTSGDNEFDEIDVPDDELLQNGRRISFERNGRSYNFDLVFIQNDPKARWLNISRKEGSYEIEWNISHPFFSPYVDEGKFLSLMQQFIFSYALAEIEAAELSTGGQISPYAIRMKLNDILKECVEE